MRKIFTGLLVVLWVLGSEAGMLARDGGRTAMARISERPTAHLSGLEEGGIYTDLPPVLVELKEVTPSMHVRVEVSRGPLRDGERGKVLQGPELARLPGDRAVMTVTGLQAACDRDGTWSVTVILRSPRGERRLATTTFELRRDLRSLDPASVRLDPGPNR